MKQDLSSFPWFHLRGSRPSLLCPHPPEHFCIQKHIPFSLLFLYCLCRDQVLPCSHWRFLSLDSIIFHIHGDTDVAALSPVTSSLGAMPTGEADSKFESRNTVENGCGRFQLEVWPIQDDAASQIPYCNMSDHGNSVSN